MISQPPAGLEPRRTQSSDVHDKDELLLDPGVPERKPRSAVKLCLLATLAVLVLAGCSIMYLFLKGIWYGLQHPHSKLYYHKPAADITDWSEVVRPMITKSDSFDIVASVWVRDMEGKDGQLYIDGEGRPERLIYSDTIFQNLQIGGKTEYTNVTLRVPIDHFKQTNISNYDLRASFVLVQQHRPQWLDGARKIYSWQPASYHSPNMRHWPGAKNRSLDDQVYDSFGITIPLIEFHNIPQSTLNSTEGSEVRLNDTAFDINLDGEVDLMPEYDDIEAVKDKGQTKNTFRLDFTGDYPKPITENHPYIVTRTHLGIIKDTDLYNRKAYLLVQKSLANKTCIDPKTKTAYEEPEWYQCPRAHVTRGVLETMVLSSRQGSENRPQVSKWENLYAPYLTALQRASGPKDIVPVPVNRSQSTSSRLSSETLNNPSFAENVNGEGEKSNSTIEDYVDVTWKLSFSDHGPARDLLLQNSLPPKKHNMSLSENEMLLEQHRLEELVGLFGFRNHEDAHPRRLNMIYIFTWVIFASVWILDIHYWYTRTSTVGISRLGTTMIASGRLIERIEDYLIRILDPTSATGPISLIIATTGSMDVLMMFKAVSRLEFVSPEKRNTRKRRWITRIYIAKATHAERTSARIEARSMRLKLQFLLALLAIAYYFELVSRHLISPVLVTPSAAGFDALLSLHAYVPPLLEILHAFRFTGPIGGGILQLMMNAQSRTYAGRYKTAAVLLFMANILQGLDMVPLVVGQSGRLDGLGMTEGCNLLLSFLSLIQAARYKSAKSSDVDKTEE